LPVPNTVRNFFRLFSPLTGLVFPNVSAMVWHMAR
jgi:hypothetical protein